MKTVIRCRACQATTIVDRPHRRRIGWVPADDIQHGPGCDRATRHLRVLHYRERIAAIRAEGRA